LIQSVQERIESLPQETRLSTIRLLAGNFQQFIVEQVCRARQVHQASLAKNEPPTIDTVIASWDGNESRLLHIDANGTLTWMESFGWVATGLGQMFVYPLLRGHIVRQMRADAGVVLAYRVIQDAIESGAYALGYPIDVCSIVAQEGQLIFNRIEDASHRRAIEDTIDVWRRLESEAFARALVPPISNMTPPNTTGKSL